MNYPVGRTAMDAAIASMIRLAKDKEELMPIGRWYWPLVKRGCRGCGVGPIGDPPTPTTRAGLDKWRRGPKVWQFNELLQFRGFRVWVSFNDTEHSEIFEKFGETKQAEPGRVEEIQTPTRVKYSAAGLVNVALKVEKIGAEGAPPLTPEEIKQAGEIIDWLEGRKGDRPRKPSPNPRGREPEYNPKEDAKIYARWMESHSMGRVSVQQFYDENEDLKKDYTPKKLRLLFDRVRQVKKKAREMARRKK